MYECDVIDSLKLVARSNDAENDYLDFFHDMY